MRKGWKKVKVKNIGTVVSGGTPDTNIPAYWDGDIYWVTPSDLTLSPDHKLFRTVRRITQQGLKNSSAKILPAHSIIVCTRASVGEIAINLVPMATNQGFKSIIPNTSIDVEFAYYQMLAHKSVLIKLACGSTFLEISKSDFENLEVFLPPLGEQKKIASILRTWDKAIEHANNLFAAQSAKKQALQQSLMSGKLRLPGFSGSWKNQKLKDLTEELKGRNQNNGMGVDKIMGVNKVHGLIPMREETIGASIDRYKQVPPDAFAYNPMRINIGSLARSHYRHPVLVSPDYVVFSCIKEKLDADYFDHFRRGHIWQKYMDAAGNGSVRIRIYYNDLGDLKIHLPDIKEQKAIAAVLNVCDQQLRLIEKEIETLKAQKRGLMQKLLTGEWPVRVEKEAA